MGSVPLDDPAPPADDPEPVDEEPEPPAEDPLPEDPVEPVPWALATVPGEPDEPAAELEDAEPEPLPEPEPELPDPEPPFWHSGSMYCWSPAEGLGQAATAASGTKKATAATAQTMQISCLPRSTTPEYQHSRSDEVARVQ